MEIQGNGAVILLVILVIVMAGVICVLVHNLCIQKKAMQKMQKQGIEKNNYLTNMSHEIRTPLNGIIGLEYLMRENVDKPEKLTLYLDKLKVSAQFLKNLVTDVLDISKIENGQLEIIKTPIDLRKVLEEVSGLIQIQTEEAGITFSMDRHLEKPEIFGDSVRLKQILVNLLGNAVKFTEKGGWIRLEISQRQLSKDTVETIFVIADNGCGMSEGFLDRIWEPFEQEGEGKLRTGNGLGTTLCKSLTEQMGGTITVDSVLGGGTRFEVRIPGETVGLEGHVTENKGEETAPQTLKKQREHLVLVADDNTINREIVCEILRGKGYKTLEAVDGEEAVRIFEKSTPDSITSILMDIRMPVMDGYEAARRIRGLDKPDAFSVKILALTANAFREELEKARESGMDGVLTKPVDVERLLQLLNEEIS